MNRERLEHGIKVLQGLQERRIPDGDTADEQGGDRFDIATWGYDLDCGTSACVGGWFTLDPTFQAQGLSNSRETGLGLLLKPQYAGLETYDALQAFFGIDTWQAWHIFESDNTNRIDHAIQRIQDVLAEADAITMRITRQSQAEEA